MPGHRGVHRVRLHSRGAARGRRGHRSLDQRAHHALAAPVHAPAAVRGPGPAEQVLERRKVVAGQRLEVVNRLRPRTVKSPTTMHPRCGWHEMVSTVESRLPSAARPGTGTAFHRPRVSVATNAWLLLMVCSSPLALLSQNPPAAQVPVLAHDTEVTQATGLAGRPEMA